MGLPHCLTKCHSNNYVRQTTLTGPSMPLQTRGPRKHPHQDLIFAAAANLVQVKQLAAETMSKTGLAKRRTFDQFLEVLRKRFPDMKDVPRKRALVKVDGGQLFQKIPIGSTRGEKRAS
eukprot:INCI16299.8.p3 GENE.INCI16299.8~~INCI16299.8.p3  ORF type:complete len:119 (-),score=20.28 INCI16299.8:415-771(-)